MNYIKAEHTEYIYFGRADEVPDVIAGGLKVETIDPFMRDRRSSSDTRLVVIPNFSQPDVGNVYYLYWADQSNLDVLDSKIENNRYDDRDFAGSVKTVFQRTECFDCNYKWPSLVIPPGDPYQGAPGLLDLKINKAKFMQCLNCNSVLRQMVVKLWANE